MEGRVEKPQREEHLCEFSVSDGLQLRPSVSSDLDEVMAIENASFSYPWSSRFFLQELKVPCARSLLAILDGKAVGYVIYWLVANEVDIHNLAVIPVHRRRGLGTALLQAVIEEAQQRKSERVTLEVRKSNEAAQKLYCSLGFKVKGVRKGYYSDDGEDALIMVLDFIP